MDFETINGQILAKANHYLAVPDSEGGRRIIKDKEFREYERNFMKQCKVYRNRLISHPFILHADVFQSSVRYDLDNSLKTILDLLQDVQAITNDNLCIGIQATKHIDPKNPRVEFSIQETEPTIF